MRLLPTTDALISARLWRCATLRHGSVVSLEEVLLGVQNLALCHRLEILFAIMGAFTCSKTVVWTRIWILLVVNRLISIADAEDKDAANWHAAKPR